jgi:sulfur-oxidizing protein SoxA
MGWRQRLPGNGFGAHHGVMTTPRAIGLMSLMVLALASRGSTAEIPRDKRRSGSTFMSGETRAMQNDDAVNPAMLWVLDGEALWKARNSASQKSCADCHSDVQGTMRGVAARYPAFDEASARPVDLEQRINLCRTQHQDQPALADESSELLALTALVARQSRGMRITAASDPRLATFVGRGRELFERRQGQLNLSCSNCHDDNWDRHLAGSSITQAHPTGYPIYRLEWQGLGSLKRRLRNCMTGIRAQTYPADAPEVVDLELFLASRASGMVIETPAVRP